MKNINQVQPGHNLVIRPAATSPLRRSESGTIAAVLVFAGMIAIVLTLFNNF